MDIRQLASSVHETTLHELFVKQVQQTPDKIALVDGDVRLTYRELDQQTNRLANYLSRYQIQESDAVGILLEKCHEYIIACLAVLKAGGAYLHLELAYPNRFLQQIFADAAPKVIITKQKHQDKMAAHQVALLYIDTNEWQAAEDTSKEVKASNHSVAIIGYSSGTTGKPKGICVSHRATLYAYSKFWEEVWHLHDKGRFAYTTFITWDALSPLVTGHTGYIVKDEFSFDPQLLLDFYVEHKINHTMLTPSLLSCILQTVDINTLRQKLQWLKIVWVGGEVMTQQLVDQILEAVPHLHLINNYGPAECFVITQGQLQANDPITPSICSVGNVLAGMEVLLCDEGMNTVAQGEVGELYATGPCLADGYLNNPTLTKQKFVSINNKIFYKTGDSARFLADDRLIILGRRDSTVKIRSYNVNLLAVEEILKQHPQISDCVVIAHGDEGEDKFLIAYLIRSTEATWEIDSQTLNCLEVSNYLQDYLPFYTIPNLYIELESFPLHPISQKLDKSSLPIPHRTKVKVEERIQIEDTPIAKQIELMAALLAELLTQGNVKESDNFFEIGLHSLLAAQLVTRIREVFDIDLSVSKIYEHSTAQELVLYINQVNSADRRSGKGGSISETFWVQDLLLDEDIVPSTQSALFSSESRAVLLTGSTGFLGTFLLAELLQVSPNITVYCLVRSADRLQTLVENLKFYQLWHEDFGERIEALVGDLEKRYFGWSQNTFELHAQRMEAVFHAGAWVNMIYPYRTLKTANVDGTREILRFASCKVNKSLHHISTLGIFPSGNVASYPENDQIDPLIGELTTGYAQTKWVAEKLIWQGIQRGISSHIYRIGNIGPDNGTYLANRNDTMMMFLDMCRRLKVAPQRDDWFFEYTPVNFVAKSIIQTALCEKPCSNVYHVSGQNLLPANRLFSAMKNQGHIETVIDFDSWIQCLRSFVKQTSNSKHSLLEQSLQIEEEFLLEQESFDTSLYIQQLQECQLSYPIVDEKYLSRSVFPETLP